MSNLRTASEIDAFLRTVPPERIVSRECKHATPSGHREGELKDMLSIKEYITLDDGTRYPTMRFVENYPRPYWVTKPPFRTHPDKIEFEELSRLDMFRIPQCQLRRDVCSKLGKGNPSDPMKRIARSPYVYALDAGPEVFMKQTYMQKWKDNFQPNRITVVDAETDVNGLLHKKLQLPILWSEVNDDEIILYVNKQWTYEIVNYADQVAAEYRDVIDQWVEKIKSKLINKKTGEYPGWIDQIAKMKLSIEIHENDFEMTNAMINHLHTSQPDIVTGWNVFFDFSVMAMSIQNAGRDPADIFSDPRVPYEYRMAYLREGQHTKMTSSGREMRLDPQERWNVILTTSSWRAIDAMQVYWQLRKAKGKESGGYGLDAVLSRQFGASKLKYKTEDTSIPANTLHWHMDMQLKYKVRYGVYNIIDSLAVWALDKKNNDLSSQISALAGPADYSIFNSQPKINSIDMLFSVLKKRKMVICSTSDQMEDENDQLVPDREGWIITFPSHNVDDTGLFLFEDMPTLRSLIHMFCADADVETTYPTAEIIQNLSKRTTMAEPCRVMGVGKETLRLASVNLTGGRVNSVEIIETVCKMPTLDEWLEQFKKDLEKETNTNIV